MIYRRILALIILCLAGPSFASAQGVSVLTVNWNELSPPTKTAITLQVVENPPLRRSSPIHDAAWKNLRELHTDATRLAFWYPYPRLAVAELSPPSANETHWDFKDIDPIVKDFFHATAGHSNVLTFSTIPTWMFSQADPGPIPASPDEAMWNYEAGTQLRDPTGAEAAAYFARVAGWYSQGGFTDELGKRHISTHHLPIAWWEVLNEPEYEHALSIEQYTGLYDRTVAAVKAVSPATKFVGMSLAEPTRNPAAFEYFLNPANHLPGTPLDAISFHFYADAEPGESDDAQQFAFFASADAFIDAVRYIGSIRHRLSPSTEIHINEAGCIAAADLPQTGKVALQAPTQNYFSLCGAVFAYLYAHLAGQGIDVLGASQLLGYPGQFPSVSLLDWKTGAPNVRYAVLQLLHDNMGPGDRIATADLKSHDLYAAAFVSPSGERKLLVINKRKHAATFDCRECVGSSVQSVEGAANMSFAHRGIVSSTQIDLAAFAVSIFTLKQRS